MRILLALLTSSLLVACGGATPPPVTPENTTAPPPVTPVTPEAKPEPVTPHPAAPAACAGPVATPPAGLVKDEEAPPAWSIGAPGKGSLCEGKVFVAKGATAPAGAAADSIVREADLPYALRIIKPTDGIPNYAFDPNRLTLVLSEDNRIVDAAWD